MCLVRGTLENENIVKEALGYKVFIKSNKKKREYQGFYQQKKRPYKMNYTYTAQKNDWSRMDYSYGFHCILNLEEAKTFYKNIMWNQKKVLVKVLMEEIHTIGTDENNNYPKMGVCMKMTLLKEVND